MLDAPEAYPLFVTQNPFYNAGAYGMDRPFIIVHSAVVRNFDDDELRFVIGHELGHAMGLGHMNGGTASFMQPSVGSNTDLNDFDRQVASFHYTRSPNNTSPDTDSSGSFLGVLVPSAAPIVSEWVCDAGEDLAAP